jgi:hypothetical protein
VLGAGADSHKPNTRHERLNLSFAFTYNFHTTTVVNGVKDERYGIAVVAYSISTSTAEADDAPNISVARTTTAKTNSSRAERMIPSESLFALSDIEWQSQAVLTRTSRPLCH